MPVGGFQWIETMHLPRDGKGAVADDPREPGLEGLVVPELPDALLGCKERLLHRILGRHHAGP